jgi:Xaa-Pro aminopeptidase
MAQAGVDALLVTHPPNLRYLAGFAGTAGALLITAANCTLLVDGRYVTAARARTSEGGELRHVKVELVERAVEEALARLLITGERVWNLGVEATAMTLSGFDRLSEALGRAEAEAPGTSAPRLRGTEDLVERGRLVKDAGEIATLREAAGRLSRVAAGIWPALQPGRTETAVAADIDAAMRGGGFERPAFETIVASGPNSALPHARPGPRVLEPGDIVVLDFGGVYDGYCVDLTRTVQLPPVNADYARLFEAVRRAHDAAIRAVRPGVLASEVDAAARLELARHGLADAFVHGTGHGLGLEVHEGPRLTRAGTTHRDERLEPGMVFTIEPGVYVPGTGGVRLEDDVLVVESGCEVLTDVPIHGMDR